MYPFSERGVGWGIYKYFSFWCFVILIFCVNGILSFLKMNKYLIPTILFFLLIFIYLIIAPYESRPYRVLLRITMSVISILSSLFIVKMWNKKLNYEKDY